MEGIMFGASLQSDDQPLVGCSTPQYVANESEPVTVRPGSGYFLVQLRNAQAVFRGPIWEQAKSLLVTSRVSLRHAALGADPALSLQRSFPIERNLPQRLGISADLIHLTPAN